MLFRLTSAFVLASLALTRPAFGEPLRFTPSKDDNYSESTTFIAALDGGTYALAQLTVTNIGPGTENAVCRILVAGPSGAPTNLSERFGAGDWAYTAGSSTTLRVGTCSVEASGRDTTVRASVKGASLTLVYAAAPAEKFPPNHAIAAGESVRFIPFTELLY